MSVGLRPSFISSLKTAEKSGGVYNRASARARVHRRRAVWKEAATESVKIPQASR